jgi:sodium/potassium-transporting ATPase subunit alpha
MASVLVLMVYVVICSHPRQPAWHFPLIVNCWPLGGLTSVMALMTAILYTLWSNRLFGAVPLPPEVFIYALPFALMLGVADEGSASECRARSKTAVICRPILRHRFGLNKLS